MKRVPFLPLALLLAGCVSVPTVERQPAAPQVAEPESIPQELPETNLPPPEGQAPVALRPASEPVPPEISAFEALRQAARLAPPEVRLLTVGGRVPLLLYDLNRDGHPECFAVAVRDRTLRPAQIESLSQSSRLFDPEAPPVGFALLVYGNSQGSLRRPALIDLGQRRVFEALTRTPLTANRAVPLAVTVSFLNLDGRDQELLVFDNAGGSPRYRRSLVESLGVRSWLEDIDADGTLDILTRERVLEEGVGYETFLTWSRWNGRAFTEVQTRNVLRNLAVFLASVRGLLLSGDLRRLAELAAEGRDLSRLRARGLGEAEVLAALLGLKAAGLKELPRVTEVLFPEILEDPFIARDAAGMYFQLTYRMVDENGLSYLPVARLYMLRNPFGERQFAFKPGAD
jgi:hypothetical protein